MCTIIYYFTTSLGKSWLQTLLPAFATILIIIITRSYEWRGSFFWQNMSDLLNRVTSLLSKLLHSFPLKKPQIKRNIAFFKSNQATVTSAFQKRELWLSKKKLTRFIEAHPLFNFRLLALLLCRSFSVRFCPRQLSRKIFIMVKTIERKWTIFIWKMSSKYLQ